MVLTDAQDYIDVSQMIFANESHSSTTYNVKEAERAGFKAVD
jgi:hypothetical protein